MSKANQSSPIDLETLFPWVLNGTVSELEEARVRRALQDGHLSDESLDEAIAAYELANERPDTATLSAFAAGELSVDEARAVDQYLLQEEAAEDRELVELARLALADEQEPSQVVRPLARGGVENTSGFWRTWAVAASLVAILLAAGWWTSAREAQGPTMTVAEVVELLPDDMVLRGAKGDPVSVEVGSAGLTVLLMVERSTEIGSEEMLLSVTLRDDSDFELARMDAVELRSDGSIHLFIEPEVAKAARRLVLEGRVDEAGPGRLIHEYSFRTAR